MHTQMLFFGYLVRWSALFLIGLTLLLTPARGQQTQRSRQALEREKKQNLEKVIQVALQGLAGPAKFRNFGFGKSNVLVEQTDLLRLRLNLLIESF